MAKAYIVPSKPPAIIFRIAARNDKAYGPDIELRLLQDQQSPEKVGVKRAGAEDAGKSNKVAKTS